MSTRVSFSPFHAAERPRELVQYVRGVLHANGLVGGSFAELFCGGASIGLPLLLQNEIERLYLNDLNLAVFAFWHTVLYEPEALQQFVRDVPVSIVEWERQRAILAEQPLCLVGLAKATLYLNQITLPGREGKQPAYVPNSRFSRRALAHHLGNVVRVRDRIRLSSLRAIDFLTMVGPNLPAKGLLLNLCHHQAGGAECREAADSQQLTATLQRLRRHWLVVLAAAPAGRTPYAGKAAGMLVLPSKENDRQQDGLLPLSERLTAPAG